MLLLANLFCSNIYTQSKYYVSLYTGFAFNTDIRLNGEAVENSQGYILDIGINRTLFNQSFLKSEIGFSVKNIFTSGKIDDKSFHASTLRVAAPVKLVLPLAREKLSLALGCIFQNNVDFVEFDFRLRDKYSWRADYLLEARYTMYKNWLLSLGFSQNIRDIPDPYFINDPKTVIRLGLFMRIGKTKNQSAEAKL